MRSDKEVSSMDYIWIGDALDWALATGTVALIIMMIMIVVKSR